MHSVTWRTGCTLVILVLLALVGPQVRPEGGPLPASPTVSLTESKPPPATGFKAHQMPVRADLATAGWREAARPTGTPAPLSATHHPPVTSQAPMSRLRIWR